MTESPDTIVKEITIKAPADRVFAALSDPTRRAILARLSATLLLMVGAIVCELALGLTMGVIAALRRGTVVDQGLMLISFVGVSAPQFVIGILLLYVFAVALGWFPIGGYGGFRELVLPSLTLGILGAGWYSRMMRSSMLDVLRQDFIRTARSKGLA